MVYSHTFFLIYKKDGIEISTKYHNPPTPLDPHWKQQLVWETSFLSVFNKLVLDIHHSKNYKLQLHKQIQVPSYQKTTSKVDTAQQQTFLY